MNQKELKDLMEKRNEKASEMEKMLELVKSESRAFTDEEMTAFDTLEKAVKDYDKTIDAEERARALRLDHEKRTGQ